MKTRGIFNLLTVGLLTGLPSVHRRCIAKNKISNQRRTQNSTPNEQDIIVLDQNPPTVAPEHIMDIKIDMTIVGRKILYDRSKD